MFYIRQLTKLYGISFILLSAILLQPMFSWTCDIPVFRYALELWPADPYEFFVVYDGSLSEEEQELVNRLNRDEGEDAIKANFRIHLFDQNSLSEEEQTSLYGDKEPGDETTLIVRFPTFMRRMDTLWRGPFTSENVESLIDSPIRQEVGRRLLNGETSVWILLESGNKEKDDAAAKLLGEKIKEMEEMLQLPVMQDMTGLSGEQIELNEGLDLRIGFSMVRLSRDDPKESFLITTLMNSETDLVEYLGEPMAFPVYGRGRALYALVGRGINEDTILDACAFMTGPCTCQVKGLNPGTDLLMAVDWQGALGNQSLGEREMSRFLGIPALAQSEIPEVTPVNMSTAGENPEAGNLIRNILIVVGVIVIINIFVFVRLYRNHAD